MTNPLDPFLRRHNVDVGHSFAVCGFLSATYKLYAMIGDWLNDKGSINLAIPIGILVAFGLWEHKSWARTLSLFVTWVAGLLVCLLVILIAVGVQGNFSLNFGTTVLQHPSPAQALIFGISVVPLFLFTLGVLHSEKARDEFKKPNQSPDPTLSSGTAPAGQAPRLP
jgi:hypothetical protein